MSYQPPSQPDPYGQPAPFAQSAPTPPPAAKKSSAGKIIGIIALVLALCCCGGIGVTYATGGFDSFVEGFEEGIQEGIDSATPSKAKVGDCVEQVADATEAVTVTNLEVVSCTAATAEGKVLGIVTGISETKFRDEAIEVICVDYPTVEQAYWEGRTGSGKVWCIGPIG